MPEVYAKFVQRIPTWMKWVLVLPVAFMAGVLFNIIARIAMWAASLSAPMYSASFLELSRIFGESFFIVFVGAHMAPSYRVVTAIALAVIFGFLTVFGDTLALVLSTSMGFYTKDSYEISVFYWIFQILASASGLLIGIRSSHLSSKGSTKRTE